MDKFSFVWDLKKQNVIWNRDCMHMYLIVYVFIHEEIPYGKVFLHFRSFIS